MNDNHQQHGWPPDKRIIWALFTLITALLCFATGGIVPILFSGLGAIPFWVALMLGVSISFVINCLRPNYSEAGRFWKSICEFLLKQMSPPD